MPDTSILDDDVLTRRPTAIPLLDTGAPQTPAIAVSAPKPAIQIDPAAQPRVMSSGGVPVIPNTPNKAIPLDPVTGKTEEVNNNGMPIRAGVAGLFTRADNVHNPVLRTLAKIGAGAARAIDIAGQVAAPGLESKIPGSEGNEAITTKRARAEQDREAKLAAENATTAHTQAETGAIPSEVELRRAEAERDLNPQPKTKTPEEQAFEGYLGQVNPETKQPYTPTEAFRKVKEDEQSVKPEKNPNDFQAFYKDYLEAHGFQDNAAHRLAARTEWAKAGQPFGQQHLDIAIQNQKDREQQADRRTIAEHDKAYVQPAEAVEKSYQMMDQAYREYEAARKAGKSLPTGAQSMVALSTHLSTTFGNVKGARVTKDMIHEHLGARSISDDALVAIQKFTNGDQLSPEQWKAFHDLISQSRKLSWKIAEKEAIRHKIPVDFLPEDLQEGGGEKPPAGAKVRDYSHL